MSTILILEDEAVLLEAISEVISLLGYDVITCRRGSVALEKLRESKGRVVALWVDLWLDDWMNGCDFLRMVADEGLFCGKVVVATGMENVEKDFSECFDVLRWKFADVTVCTKPVTVEEIREALRDVAA